MDFDVAFNELAALFSNRSRLDDARARWSTLVNDREGPDVAKDRHEALIQAAHVSGLARKRWSLGGWLLKMHGARLPSHFAGPAEAHASTQAVDYDDHYVRLPAHIWADKEFSRLSASAALACIFLTAWSKVMCLDGRFYQLACDQCGVTDADLQELLGAGSIERSGDGWVFVKSIEWQP